MDLVFIIIILVTDHHHLLSLRILNSSFELFMPFAFNDYLKIEKR